MSLTDRETLQLVVIGSGDPPDELERLQRLATGLGVEMHVHFLGYVPGRAVDVIAQLDLLVVATRSFEGFGLTLIEAMSVGVPIVATTVGAIPEFVHSDIGVLVSPGAPSELATALADFVVNPAPWQQRAALAQQRLLLNKVNMAEEYRRLFVECLA